MNLKELARKAISTLFLSMLCLVAFAQGRQVNRFFILIYYTF